MSRSLTSAIIASLALAALHCCAIVDRDRSGRLRRLTGRHMGRGGRRPRALLPPRPTEAHVALAAELLPTGDRLAGIAILAVKIGALLLARAVADRALSDQILESSEKAALMLAREFSTPAAR